MKRLLLLVAVGGAILAQASTASADSTTLTPKRPGRETPEFLPTLSLGVGLDYGPNRSQDVAYGSFWLGASHYPVSAPWSPFYSVGAELDLRTVARGNGGATTAAVFGPQVRGGISYFPDNNGYLSVFNAYALAGYRAPSSFEGHAFRFGVGISSPGVGIVLLSTGFVLPWMLEAACDISENGARPSIRFGLSY